MTKGWWEKNPPKYTLVLQRVIEEGKKFCCSNYITFPKRPFFCISHLNFSRKKTLFLKEVMVRFMSVVRYTMYVYTFSIPK